MSGDVGAGASAELVEGRPRLIFVGINPGMRSAAVGAPFAGSNRFFPALWLAGITAWRISTSEGWRPADRDHLVERGVAIMSLAPRPTPGVADLSAEELHMGAAGLEAAVSGLGARIIAILGVTGYRIAFKDRAAELGDQRRRVGGAQLWIVPNPSGRNRSVSLTSLAESYRQVAEIAGVTLGERRIPTAPHQTHGDVA